MSSFQEIASAIEALPREDYVRLLGWMRERDWADWDQQVERDAVAGNLNFLQDEAADAKNNGSLKDL